MRYYQFFHQICDWLIAEYTHVSGILPNQIITSSLPTSHTKSDAKQKPAPTDDYYKQWVFVLLNGKAVAFCERFTKTL